MRLNWLTRQHEHKRNGFLCNVPVSDTDRVHFIYGKKTGFALTQKCIHGTLKWYASRFKWIQG